MISSQLEELRKQIVRVKMEELTVQAELTSEVNKTLKLQVIENYWNKKKEYEKLLVEYNELLISYANYF